MMTAGRETPGKPCVEMARATIVYVVEVPGAPAGAGQIRPPGLLVVDLPISTLSTRNSTRTMSRGARIVAEACSRTGPPPGTGHHFTPSITVERVNW